MVSARLLWYIDQAQYIDVVRAHNLANINNKLVNMARTIVQKEMSAHTELSRSERYDRKGNGSKDKRARTKESKQSY